MDTMFLFLCFQASKNFTQLAGQNGTRLVARFDWDQRFVTEPPSYWRDLWSIGRFWSLQPQLLAPRAGPKSDFSVISFRGPKIAIETVVKVVCQGRLTVVKVVKVR